MTDNIIDFYAQTISLNIKIPIVLRETRGELESKKQCLIETRSGKLICWSFAFESVSRILSIRQRKRLSRMEWN